jgi:hypothetical protein
MGDSIVMYRAIVPKELKWKGMTMAKPLRIHQTEFDPALHLRPEELVEYEALEARLDTLSQEEIRKYERLMLTAYAHYSISVESIDRFLK